MGLKHDKLPMEIKECAINYCDCDDLASVQVFQKKMAKKILELADCHPDEIKIVAKNNNGVLVAHMPKKYISISFREPKTRTMTEDQIAAVTERLKKARELKKG